MLRFWRGKNTNMYNLKVLGKVTCKGIRGPGRRWYKKSFLCGKEISESFHAPNGCGQNQPKGWGPRAHGSPRAQVPMGQWVPMNQWVPKGPPWDPMGPPHGIPWVPTLGSNGSPPEDPGPHFILFRINFIKFFHQNTLYSFTLNELYIFFLIF